LSDEEPPLTEDDYRIFSRIPTWGLEMPCLEDDCSWYCPQYNRGCPYHFNLRTLGAEERAHLPEVVARALGSNAWRPSDPWVMNALKTLTDAHYDGHLEEVNVRKTCVLNSTGQTVVREPFQISLLPLMSPSRSHSDGSLVDVIMILVFYVHVCKYTNCGFYLISPSLRYQCHYHLHPTPCPSHCSTLRDSVG
jgi:hypothetical protein